MYDKLVAKINVIKISSTRKMLFKYSKTKTRQVLRRRLKMLTKDT